LTSSSKILHVVGGGINQIPLVQTANRMGFKVLVTDMYANPPCRQIADHFEQINTTDRHNSLGCSQKYNITHVATDQTDVAVPTVAFIAEEMGLTGIGYETSLRFTNKHEMRRSLNGKLDSSMPEYKFFSSGKEAKQYCAKLDDTRGFIVKPINSQGSKGVAVLNEDHTNSIDQAVKESGGQGIIIEQFISGPEYSVESFVHEGEIHHLALAKKFHYDSNPCLDLRNTFLGDVERSLEKTIFALNEKVIQTLGLSMGNTHAEYKVENGQVYLIEIAARGAGGSIASKIIPYLTDFNPLESLLKQMSGELDEIEYKNYRERFATLKFFDFPNGRVKRVQFDRERTKKLMAFHLELQPGDKIKTPRNSNERHGYFIVHGSSRQATIELEKQIEKSVNVEYAID